MYTKNILMSDIENKRVNKEKLYTWCEEDDGFDAMEYLKKLQEENNLSIEKVRIEIEMQRKFK